MKSICDENLSNKAKKGAFLTLQRGYILKKNKQTYKSEI